ncbi:MAG: tetratricopeptide repeat protein, partial [Planctomycetota bacterium]
MKHVMLAILPLVGILLLGGCAVSRMVDRGDESLLSGRPRDAVRFYERAATKDPDLLLDQGFTSKLNKARALKAYEDGQRLAAEDRWDEALARFGDALEHDPLLHEARRALKDARQEASRLHHRRALRFADEGRLNDAIRELRKALEIDPENPDARDALDSVEQKKRKNLNHAAELYGEARQLMAARQWQKVGAALDRVLQENPNHVPARVDRHDVRSTIRAAEAKADEAETLLDEKKLNRARTRIRQALDAWPAFARARDLLAQADAGLGRAERLYEQAVELGEKGRWDEAVRAGSQSLAVFPYSDDRRAFLRRARGQAADAHARAGDRLLAKGNLDEAEARYARALGFVPGHAKAKEGLAEADVRRGAAAEAAGLWGNALLWYRQAAEHSPEARFAARVRAAHRRITDRVTFSVRTQFRDRADAATSFTRLRSGVLTHLSGAKPDIVRLLGAGDATYKVSIALDEIRVEQELAATEHRVHTYVEYRAVPNPEVPRLDALLRSAERKLARLRRAYHQPCPVCHGTGRIIRPQPRPRPPKREERRPDRKREKPRPPRRDDHRDEGHDDRDHDDRDGGRHDREREQPRRVTCPRCHGTGRWSKVSRTDI